MDSKFIQSVGASALAVALSLLFSAETHAQQRSGVEIWEATCGRCHLLQPTNKYYPKDWRSVGTHMAITARLTSAQTDAVIAFLISGARTDATASRETPTPPSDVAVVRAESPGETSGRLVAYLRELERAPALARAPN